ncbi:MAG: TraB/GumN family protein [Bradymonadia bacterium]
MNSPNPDFENVTVLERDGRTFYLVGTAHISQRSVDEVKHVIDTLQPDTVCVELCQTRYDTLNDPDRWRKLDIFQIIKQGKVLFLLSNLALSAYQKQMGEKLGVNPGAEMTAAIEKAREHDAELVLADRNIQATLKRTWHNMSLLDRFKVLGELMGSFFGEGEELTEETLEKMKDKDTLGEMMAEFARRIPGVKRPLIDERDHFLMSATEDAPGKTVVSVVGAAHVPGMVAHFGKGADREALSVIPPTRLWVKALKWVIPALILIAFYFGYQKHEGEGLSQMLYAWILPNSIMCALLTAVGMGKPLSILTAFIASPITSLNPALGAGMVVGLVEAWLRKPTVEDCERIPQDVQTMKGFYRNPFLRVLVVATLATIGSALGAWVGAFWVGSLL